MSSNTGPSSANSSAASPSVHSPTHTAVEATRDGAQRRTVVLKFGGSSVADEERLRMVAARVAERARTEGVVVVVSAMGKTTDRLVAAARRLATRVPPRELDMLLSTGERESMALLAIALAELGVEAISLTGSQCGLITDHRFGQARVMEVRPFRILDELAAGRVVIVGGFQGVSYRRDVTTLGRGGSDTSAVALAAAIGADCEIYSDVDGVYSGDPREVEGSFRLDGLDYDTMHELARRGAKVLHARAIELAARSGIAIYARATHGGGETVVRVVDESPRGVVAVARDQSVSLMRISWDRVDVDAVSADVAAPAETQVASGGRNEVPGPLAAIFGLGLRSLHQYEGVLQGWWSDRQRDDGDALAATIADAVEETRHHGGPRAKLELERALELVSCVGVGIDEMPEVIAQARAIAAPHDPLALEVGARALCFFVRSSSGGAQLADALHRSLLRQS